MHLSSHNLKSYKSKKRYFQFNVSFKAHLSDPSLTQLFRAKAQFSRFQFQFIPIHFMANRYISDDLKFVFSSSNLDKEKILHFSVGDESFFVDIKEFLRAGALTIG